MNAKLIKEGLLIKYPSNTYGIWEILGEDPNCDFGGHHSQPKLKIVEGTYCNVVNYALTLKGFVSWGSGGNINLISPQINVDDFKNSKVLALQDEKDLLSKRIKEIENEVNVLIQGDIP